MHSAKCPCSFNSVRLDLRISLGLFFGGFGSITLGLVLVVLEFFCVFGLRRLDLVLAKFNFNFIWLYKVSLLSLI